MVNSNYTYFLDLKKILYIYKFTFICIIFSGINLTQDGIIIILTQYSGGELYISYKKKDLVHYFNKIYVTTGKEPIDETWTIQQKARTHSLQDRLFEYFSIPSVSKHFLKDPDN